LVFVDLIKPGQLVGRGGVGEAGRHLFLCVLIFKFLIETMLTQFSWSCFNSLDTVLPHSCYIFCYCCCYVLQSSFHSVAVALTLVQTKQIRINIHKKIHNTVQTIQNTVNTSTHITKTRTHYKTHTYTHSTYTHPHIIVQSSVNSCILNSMFLQISLT